MKYDSRNIEERSFEVYPSGPYVVKIKSIEEVMASTGNPQLKVSAEIVSSPEPVHLGKPVTDFITLTETAAWKLDRFLNGMKVDTKKLGVIDTDSGQFRNLLNKLVNKTTIWTLTQITDRNGNPRNRVVDWKVDEARVEDDDLPEFLSKAEEEQETWDAS